MTLNKNIFYDANKLTINNFYLPKKYDCSDENLKKYAIELIKDNELKDDLKFNYIEEFKTKTDVPEVASTTEESDENELNEFSGVVKNNITLSSNDC